LHTEAALPEWVRERDPETDEPRVVVLDAGQNPPAGAPITYYLRETLPDDVDLTLTVHDAEGQVLATMSSREPNAKAEGPKQPRLNKRAGSHRVYWNMRYPGPTPLPGAVLWGGEARGPVALPGTYRLTLKAGDAEAEGMLELVPDPRLHVPADARERRFQLLLEVRDAVSRAHQAVLDIRAIRDQLQAWVERSDGHPVHDRLKEAVDGLLTQLAEVEEALLQTKAKSPQDVLNYPVKLNAKLVDIAGVVESAPGDPPQQAVQVFRELEAACDAECRRLQQLVEGPLQEIQALIRSADLPPVRLGRSSGAPAESA